MRQTDVDLLASFVPRLPAAAECSFAAILAERAARSPDAPFALFAQGRRWSNAEGWDAVRQAAARLRACGVAKGDRVVLWLPNGAAMLRLLLACSAVGAVAVPINTAYRGGILDHVIAKAQPGLIVAHAELRERLDSLALSARVATLGADRADDFDAIDPADHCGDAILNQPWDDAIVIFTSGTTGPSKGVMTSYAQQWTVATVQYLFAGPQDRFLVAMPLFHIAGLGGLFAALIRGGTIAVYEPVSPSAFWDVVRETESTCLAALPAGMIDLLLKRPASEDRPHPLRVYGGTIVDATMRAFGDRFGVDVIARYSMSETSGITVSRLNPTVGGTMGAVRPGVEVRLVDDNDVAVADGAVGEVILRTDLPWTLFSGYIGDPEATLRAWRNGWFHTGDLARRDPASGEYIFVDRKKDAVRRRGENISAWEVENEARGFQGVATAAVVGVDDGAGGGDEVLVVLQRNGAAIVDPAAFTAFMIERLPHFMVPRYVRIVDALPQTETGKVRKSDLRDAGLLPGDWDREAHGLAVRRTKLSGAI